MSGPGIAPVTPSASFLRDSAIANRAALQARYPAVFPPDWRTRTLVLGSLAAALAAFIGGFAILDVSWSRVFAGMGRLGEFVELMLPPDFGTVAKLQSY